MTSSITDKAERPILFSGPMVKAILAARKSQTRRVIFKDDPRDHMPWRCAGTHWQDGDETLRCPYAVGKRLWVRETWRCNHIGGLRIEYKAGGACLEYDCWPKDAVPPYARPDSPSQVRRTERQFAGERIPDSWRPSIHMPRWASRITLEVTGVRVERLQEIPIEDVLAEGFEAVTDGPHANQYWREETGAKFAALWDKLNGKKHPWKSDPWVWVVGFRRADP